MRTFREYLIMQAAAKIAAKERGDSIEYRPTPEIELTGTTAKIEREYAQSPTRRGKFNRRGGDV